MVCIVVILNEPSFVKEKRNAGKSAGGCRLLVLRSGLGGKRERKERYLCVEYSALVRVEKVANFRVVGERKRDQTSLR